MELKELLKDYTAAEFQALVDKIWAVDLPKQDHDRLINHFDQIVNHPKGADLLFNTLSNGWSGPESVVHEVRGWHQQQNISAFKDERISKPIPSVPIKPVTRSLAEVQKISAGVAASAQVVTNAFDTFALAIEHSRNQQGAHLDISRQEMNIRDLEFAQHETYLTISRYEFWKMNLEFFKTSAQRNLTSARSERAQWQSIAQQSNSTYDGYIVLLEAFAQRHRALHDEAEALLISAQEQLIRSRTSAEVEPNQTNQVINATLAFADKRPAVLLDSEPSELSVAQQASLQKSIRSAVSEFTWQKTSSEPVDKHQCAAVLSFEFSSRADVGVYGLSVPLIELLSIEGQDWQWLAATEAEIDIPFRLGTSVVAAQPGTMFKGLRELQTLAQIYLTQSQQSHSGVRVRPAHLDKESGKFRFTADGSAPITVNWTSPFTLETSPLVVPTPLPRLGGVYSSPVPTIESLAPAAEEASFDDYIVVFPIDSGLDPLYLTLSH